MMRLDLDSTDVPWLAATWRLLTGFGTEAHLAKRADLEARIETAGLLDLVIDHILNPRSNP